MIKNIRHFTSLQTIQTYIIFTIIVLHWAVCYKLLLYYLAVSCFRVGDALDAPFRSLSSACDAPGECFAARLAFGSECCTAAAPTTDCRLYEYSRTSYIRLNQNQICTHTRTRTETENTATYWCRPSMGYRHACVLHMNPYSETPRVHFFVSSLLALFHTCTLWYAPGFWIDMLCRV